MPYSSIEDLPEPVRSALPDGGQRIFLAAFNAAFEGTCKNDPDLEECANRVAWAAVKEKYEKSGDGWIERTRKITYEPPEVPDDAPESLKVLIRDVYQSCREDNPGEDPSLKEKCAKIAWAAAGEKYTKSGDTWVERTRKEWKCPPSVFNCTAPVASGSEPRAILNVLDTFQHFPSTRYPEGLHLWYGANEFSGTESSLESVPLIFAQTHPDGRLIPSDLPAALAAVKTYDGRPGRTVGMLDSVKILREGQPRIEVGLKFTDSEAERLWHENKLSLSSSIIAYDEPFPGMPENYRKVRPGLKPNHILVFVRSPRDLPGDPGAMFLNNKKESTKMPEDVKNPPSPIEAKLAEMDQELRNMKAAWSQAQSDIKTKDEQIKVAELDQKERQWNRIAEVLPRGWVHGEEEAKSREMFEKKPAEFVLKLVTTLNDTHIKAIEKAGEEYQRKTAKPPKKLADVCTGLRVNGKAVGDES